MHEVTAGTGTRSPTDIKRKRKDGVLGGGGGVGVRGAWWSRGGGYEGVVVGGFA